jgi:excisionase family DNA binding protein
MEMVMKRQDSFMSLKQVTEMVGLSRCTVYRWMGAGRFPRSRKLPNGKHIRFSTLEIEAWMAQLPLSKESEWPSCPSS